MSVSTLDRDLQHLTAAMDTPWPCAVDETFILSHIGCTKYTQKAADHVTPLIERNIDSRKGLLARTTVNIVLIWLLWKWLMLLLFFLSASLIVDIAVSTMVSGDDGYEGAMRAVRLIELHLIRLIMAVLIEFLSNVRTTLMACTCPSTVQSFSHFASRWEARTSVLAAR
jgi:hypothetical protein